jgi:uncharacterized protein (TIGR02246 family)
MERKRSFVATLLLALTLAIPLSAQEAPTEVQQLERALSASPDHGGMWIELAAAQARAGNKAEAVKWLEKAVARELDFDIAENPAFAPFLETPEFKALVERARANLKVVSRSRAAFKLPEKDLIPEGIAHDPKTGAFFVGSLAKNKIVRVDKAGKASDFTNSGQDGLWAVIGMKVDPATRTLWACSAEAAQQAGASGLFRYDLDTGKLLGKITLPDKPQPHLLNDLAFGAGGEVFVTDSKAGVVHRLRPGKNELEVLVASGTFIYPNGIAASPDGKRLFVADFARHLSIVDVATGQVRPLPHPQTVNVVGIDGLYLHAGSLIAVQNGTGAERILRFQLNTALDAIESAEILESRNPLFEIPTTGVVVGDSFFYIANSQLRSLDDQGKVRADAKLEESVVLEVPLQAQQKALLAAGGAEQELRALETARTEAIRAGDSATLEKLYADDFRGVTSGGQTVDKASILEVLKRAAGGLPAEIEDLKVRIHGDTAVVTGLIRLSALSQEGRVAVNSFRYTHIYARRDGRWQMIAGQSTNVPAASSTGSR